MLLKITSLNAVVIAIRLFISIFIQRLLAELVGEAGIAKIGQLRNLSELITLLVVQYKCIYMNKTVLPMLNTAAKTNALV